MSPMGMRIYKEKIAPDKTGLRGTAKNGLSAFIAYFPTFSPYNPAFIILLDFNLKRPFLCVF
jgi:hypothetical protein